MRRVDYLVVGQGLAGSLLSWQLMARGQAVLVIDATDRPSASRCAAGIINPISGRRWARTPDFEAHYATAQRTYLALSQQLDETLFKALPLQRLLRAESEIDVLQRRQRDARYAGLIGTVFAPGHSGYRINDPLGSVAIHQAGHVRTAALLDGLRKQWQATGNLISDRFDYAELEQGAAGQWVWRDVHSSRVVFCEGGSLAANPWFDRLPLQPVAGEILSLETRLPVPPAIINKGTWVLPTGDYTCRVGATYAWAWRRLEPTTRARAHLLTAFAALFIDDMAPRVQAQCVGVRVGTPDKYPLLGEHPHVQGLFVFNGFGSKGALLIPDYAERMAQHLTAGDELPARAQIARYMRP